MLDKSVLKELENYIEQHLNTLQYYNSFELVESPSDYIDLSTEELDRFIKSKQKPLFKELLFRYIDQRKVKDSYIYKKAGIDRRHFSKIRSNKDYRPGKNTVIALALALELNKKESDKLLTASGYSLSQSESFDLIIQFCIEKKIYNIHSVNHALDYFSLQPLIGVEKD